MKKFFIVGNWKMNGLSSAALELKACITEMKAKGNIEAKGGDKEALQIIICPPFTLIASFAAATTTANSAIQIGGQDCHPSPSGAHTGDISAPMLADLGAKWVICGHSERRTAYNENNTLVKHKAEAAIQAKLTPIICVGESAKQRKQGQTLAILEEQVKDSIPESGDYLLAYEPVWAIGSGQAAKPNDIQQAHHHISNFSPKPILYGGSVTPQNTAQIAAISQTSGLLIGSAALKANSFLSIISTCKTSS